MKKFGYTLQEVLITMSIIGVIAALTVPMITLGSRSQSYATKLAATVSDFENALSTMLVKEVVEDITETGWYQNDYDGETLAEHYKLQGVFNSGEKGTYTGKSKEGNSNKNYKIDYDIAYISNNGSLIFVDMETNPATRDGAGTYLGRIFFDVTGTEGPNQVGRDIFGYALTDTGHLFPMGSDRASLLIDNNYNNIWTRGTCEDGDVTIFCTGRLAEKGYKVDY